MCIGKENKKNVANNISLNEINNLSEKVPILHFIHYLSGAVEMHVMRQSRSPLSEWEKCHTEVPNFPYPAHPTHTQKTLRVSLQPNISYPGGRMGSEKIINEARQAIADQMFKKSLITMLEGWARVLTFSKSFFSKTSVTRSTWNIRQHSHQTY